MIISKKKAENKSLCRGLTPSVTDTRPRTPKKRIQHILFAIDQWLALQGFHLAGGVKNGMGGAGVPFASRSQSWVDVGMALGNLAELEGTACLNKFVGRKLLNKGLGVVVQMVFASHNAHDIVRLRY